MDLLRYFTRHICTATHGGFNLPVTIRAFGNVNRRSGIGGYRVMNKFLSTGSARHRAYAHPTLLTRICCHFNTLI